MTNGMLFFLITKLINNHQHNRSVSKETGEERDENRRRLFALENKHAAMMRSEEISEVTG